MPATKISIPRRAAQFYFQISRPVEIHHHQFCFSTYEDKSIHEKSPSLLEVLDGLVCNERSNLRLTNVPIDHFFVSAKCLEFLEIVEIVHLKTISCLHLLELSYQLKSLTIQFDI